MRALIIGRTNQEKYPNTKFYKAHTISALPFEIKDPLGA